jgi:hypothetical protein
MARKSFMHAFLEAVQYQMRQNSKCLNLSTSFPEQLPILTSRSARPRRDRDHGFPRRAERREAEIGFTDDTSEERRFKLHPHLP